MNSGKQPERYGRWNVVGVSLCILAALPLLIAAMLSESAVAVIAALCVTLALARAWNYVFDSRGHPLGKPAKAVGGRRLQPGGKRRRHGRGGISAAFWLGTVSIYLAYSFITGDWRRSWIVWPVAGVLYAALAGGVFRAGADAETAFSRPCAGDSRGWLSWTALPGARAASPPPAPPRAWPWAGARRKAPPA